MRSPNIITSLVPIILAVLLVATGLAGRAARAGDDCLAGPNADAPQGRHWYYRFDRATHRKCWYLGQQGVKVRHAAPASPRSVAAGVGPSAPVQSVAQRVPAADAMAATEVPPAMAAPAPVAEATRQPVFALHQPDAVNDATIAAAPTRDDVQRATLAPDPIVARPMSTPAERQAAAAVTGERTALPAALAGAAVLLAVVGTILLRAERRARREHERTAPLSRRPAPWSRIPMVTTYLDQRALQPVIDPMPPEAIDTGPDVEQSLRQLRPKWKPLAA